VAYQEKIRSENNTTYVSLYYQEHETDQVPAAPGDGEAHHFSRIEESFKLAFEADTSVRQGEGCESIPQPREETGGIPLARLKLEQGLWKIDPTFQRPCIKN
jgi:hypothetical protein